MIEQLLSWPFVQETVIGLGSALLGLFAKFLLSRWVFQRIANMIERWIKGDPKKHATYLHFREDHAAPNPRECEEGLCPTTGQ